MPLYNNYIFSYRYSTLFTRVLKNNTKEDNKMKIIKKEEFPQVLQNFLDSHSITQAELARMLDVPKQTVNGWIKGRTMPKYERLERLMEMMEE